jgi:hypothetical protein
MRNENTYSRPSRVTDLPDDFPRRVIAQARFEQRQRRHRRYLAAAALATLIVAAIPFTTLIKPSGEDQLPRDPDATAQSGWQGRSLEAQLASATAPAGIGDYLMPNAAPLGNFAASYTGYWQYDPSWPERE